MTAGDPLLSYLDCCPDWEPETKKINGPVALQQIRAGQSVPAGHFKPWRFCPWCGRAARTARIDE